MKLERFQGVNAGYVFELYERYRQDPNSVDPAAREVFEHWNPEFAPGSASGGDGLQVDPHVIVGAANLAESIRRFGHLAAHLDPLGSTPPGDPSLSPAAHGVTEADLRRLPADLVGGPAAERAANAWETIEKLR